MTNLTLTTNQTIQLIVCVTSHLSSVCNVNEWAQNENQRDVINSQIKFCAEIIGMLIGGLK